MKINLIAIESAYRPGVSMGSHVLPIKSAWNSHHQTNKKHTNLAKIAAQVKKVKCFSMYFPKNSAIVFILDRR